MEGESEHALSQSAESTSAEESDTSVTSSSTLGSTINSASSIEEQDQKDEETEEDDTTEDADPNIQTPHDLQTVRHNAAQKLQDALDPVSSRVRDKTALAAAVNLYFHVLHFQTRALGETHPECAASYFDYANCFFRLLQKSLDDGDKDEREDENTREDWDVVTECLFRALSGAQRRGDPELTSKSLHTLCSAYVEREDFKAARDIAERRGRECPSTEGALQLAQTYLLCEQYTSALAALAPLRREGTELSETQKEQLEEMEELLKENDPTKLKWEIRGLAKSVKVAHTSLNPATGNVISVFQTTARIDNQNTLSTTNSANNVTKVTHVARSKRSADEACVTRTETHSEKEAETATQNTHTSSGNSAKTLRVD